MSKMHDCERQLGVRRGGGGVSSNNQRSVTQNSGDSWNALIVLRNAILVLVRYADRVAYKQHATIVKLGHS
jgi:hypothetical protein